MCFNILLYDPMINILASDLTNIDIFMCNIMSVAAFIYYLRSKFYPYALFNYDQCPWKTMINFYDRNMKWNIVLHKITGIECCTEYYLETAWTVVWPNNNLPDKFIIPTHSCGQAVYFVPKANYQLLELYGQLSLICNHIFGGTILDFPFTYIDVFSDKKHPIFMWFFILDMDFLPFFLSSMALFLSWYMVDSLNLYNW